VTPTAPDTAPASEPPPRRAPLVGPRAAYALAVLSGVLYFVGVPGMNVWPAAFVAYVPLLVALVGRAPRAAALIGLCAGFTASMGGFYWLFGMLRVFSGMPIAICAVLMVLMCAYQGGRMALTSWLASRADARGWPWEIAFVLGSASAELLYPLLFPWYFAFMMHRTPLLMQAADLGGVHLVGVVLLLPNLALFELVRARLGKDRARMRLVIIGLAAPLLAAAYGAVRIRQIEARAAAAQAVTIGVAQGNLPLLERADGLAVHQRLTESLRDRGAHLVVWSEGAVPNVFDEAKYKESAKRITQDLAVPVIFGAAVRRKLGPDKSRELNTALLADADGSIVGRYDKHYLLPFGEFIPFGETFPWLYEQSPNSGRMIPGDSLAPVVLAGHPITVLICYEDILPWFVNDAVAAGKPELLVNVTIDTWFGRTIEPWEHLALAQLRAVEHRRYLVRATNSGVSAIVDAAGRVVVHGGLFTEESFLGEVRLMAPATMYEAVGDTPFYVGALASLAMAMLRRRGRRARGARARGEG
jgi:apolipoprotein N-acyltransferase